MLVLGSLLLADSIYLPASLFLDVLEKIRDTAWEELYGPENIKRELLRLQLAVETGEITEEEYAQAEEILLARLEG